MYREVFFILKEEIIRQINTCKTQISDLEENLKNLNVEAKKLKQIQDDTHASISNIKKEISGLKRELFTLEKEEVIPEKIFL